MKKERKAFNFYRSYFDVYSELPDKDRLLFIDALLRKQFFDEEPKLTGLAKFAYISQKHSIDAQVDGYKSKTKSELSYPSEPPSVGGRQGGTEPPSVQEKEKEKEKGKEEEKEKEQIGVIFPFDSSDFFEKWNLWKKYKREEHKFSYKSKVSEQAALKKLADLSGGDESKAIAIIIQSMENGWKGFFNINTNNNGNFDIKRIATELNF